MNQNEQTPSQLACVLASNHHYLKHAIDIEDVFSVDSGFPAKLNLLESLIFLLPKLHRNARQEAWSEACTAIYNAESRSEWKLSAAVNDGNPLYRNYKKYPLAAFLLQVVDEELESQSTGIKLILLDAVLKCEHPRRELIEHADIMRKAMRTNKAEREILKSLPKYINDYEAYLNQITTTVESQQHSSDLLKSLKKLLIKAEEVEKEIIGALIDEQTKPDTLEQTTINKDIKKAETNLPRQKFGGVSHIKKISNANTPHEPPELVQVLTPELTRQDEELNDEATIRQDEFEADKQIRKSSWWLSRHYNLIPTFYGRFTNLEKNELAKHILNGLKDKDNKVRQASGIIGCMYLSGMDLETLLDAKLGGNCADFSSDGKLIRRITLPDESFTPKEEQLQQLDKITDTIELALPEPLANWITSLFNKDLTTLGQAIEVSRNEVEESVKEWLKNLRYFSSSRVRLERISSALSLELTLQVRDPVITYYISSKTTQVPPMLAYYTAHSANKLTEAYHKVSRSMLNLDIKNKIQNHQDRVGYLPTSDALSNIVGQFSYRIEQSMQSSSLAVRHNAFTDYCLVLLFVATGHRPVESPFYSSKLFDLKNGIVLISDKTTHKEREWRAVSLPKIAVEQIENYYKHLLRVAARLEENGDNNLSTQIKNLIDLDAHHNQPLFFYLDETHQQNTIIEISPSTLKNRWDKVWHLPLNFFRHVLAHNLTINMTGEHAQIQIGHFSGYKHPFGASAAKPTKTTLDEIATHVNNILEELNLIPKETKIRLPKNYKASEIDTNINLDKKPFTPKRFEKSEKKHMQANALVRDALNKVIPNKRITSQEELSNLENHIISSSDSKCTNLALRLLNRYVWRIPGSKSILSFSHKRIFSIEDSPFNENLLYNYYRLQKARQSFIDYLDELYDEKNHKDILICFSEIIVSTAIFGGISDKNKLNSIPWALKNRTFKFAKQLFVEIPLSGTNDGDPLHVFRWFPDPITHLLINGIYHLHSSYLKKPGKLSNLSIQSKIKDILNRIGLDVKEKNIYRVLSDLANAALVIEAPGHISPYIRGEKTSVSIPLEQWVRVNSNRSLTHNINTEFLPSETTNYHTSTITQDRAQSNIITHRDYLRRLKNIFLEGKSAQVPGNLRPSSIYKNSFVKIMHEARNQEAHLWSQTCQVISAWSMHLCQHGTLKTSNLRFSTVQQYTYLVAKNLLSHELEIEFLDMDGSDFENLYLDILESESYDNRNYLAGRLVEFHRFLEQTYSCDSVEWNLIYRTGGATQSQSFADANYLSENEYSRLVSIIYDSDDIDEKPKIQLIALLIFGYRFGLRFGEAHKLLHQDIQLLDNQYTVIIKCNAFAENKTSAGRRVVPQLENISSLESGILQKLIKSASVAAETDKLTPLFFAEQGIRQLEQRSYLSIYLSKCLKAVTGDDSLRFHHLRHSWATRLYAYLYQHDNFGSSCLASNQINSQWWNNFLGYADFQYPLSSLSTAIGHSSEESTLSTYVHSTDLGINNLYSLEDYKPSHRAIAYAAGNKTIESIKQKSSRNSLLSIEHSIPEPNIKLKSPLKKFSHNSFNKPSILTLVQIEQTIIRVVDTGLPTQKVANDLLLSIDNATKILTTAAHIERNSGFQYYNADAAISNSSYDKRQIFKKQDATLINNLQMLQSTISQMSAQEKLRITNALETWSKSRSKEYQVLADHNDFIELQWMANLLLGVSLEKTNAVKSIFSVKQIEKTELRRKNSFTAKFITNKHYSTSQIIGRAFLVLSVYFNL